MNKFGAFTKNNRIVYAENNTDFLNNLGSYLYFSQSARFLTVTTFEADTIPVDLYNFQVENNQLSPYEQIKEEHIDPIIKLKQDLEFIKQSIQKPRRILLEAYGHTDLGYHVALKIKLIAEKIIKGEQLTTPERKIFNYEKSKYDNVTDASVAEMILIQFKIWDTRLDNAILEMMTQLDSNISGGF
jgi:hypothetical protein